MSIEGGTEFRLRCQKPVAASPVGPEGKPYPCGAENAFTVEDDDRRVVGECGDGRIGSIAVRDHGTHHRPDRADVTPSDNLRRTEAVAPPRIRRPEILALAGSFVKPDGSVAAKPQPEDRCDWADVLPLRRGRSPKFGPQWRAEITSNSQREMWNKPISTSIVGFALEVVMADALARHTRESGQGATPDVLSRCGPRRQPAFWKWSTGRRSVTQAPRSCSPNSHISRYERLKGPLQR